MRCAAPPKSSGRWSTATPRSPRRNASRSALVSISATLSPMARTFMATASISPRGSRALAEPGGLCISRTVRDHIGDRLPYTFEDIGEQSVKNIAQPVHAYGLNATAVASLPEVTVPLRPIAPNGRNRLPLALLAAIIAAVIGIGAWSGGPGPKAIHPLFFRHPTLQACNTRMQARLDRRRACPSSSCLSAVDEQD